MPTASPKDRSHESIINGALRLDRHHLHILDPTVRREPPDADVPAAQVAVGVPVERGRGAFVVDLLAPRGAGAALPRRLKA